MKKLMAFFAFISIIILIVPVNCYSWADGTDRSTMLANDNPFISYFYAHYIPDLYNSNNFFSEYGIPNNMSTGSILNHMQLYGYNQPYNYGWNQPFNSYGYRPSYPYGNDFGSSPFRYQQPYNFYADPFPWEYQMPTLANDMGYSPFVYQNHPYGYYQPY